MESDLTIPVAALDTPHRRALEEVIGRELVVSQQLIISVIDVSAPVASTPATSAARPPQTLEDWTSVYDGLSDEEIEAVDQIAKTRADLSRDYA